MICIWKNRYIRFRLFLFCKK